jgi:enoyl-CoA hydratase/carnithine racemase
VSVETFGDVTLTRRDAVAEVVFSRPPNNFFDLNLIRDIASALESVDRQPDLRAVVLASEGKSFCAGASFSGGEGGSSDPGVLYGEALRIFATRKPIIAAVQGAAIGGGMGLAMAADFRVVTPETRLAANFVKIGIHPGFGLTYTLPRAVGAQAAALLFYTGRRIGGEEALKLGAADVLAPAAALREQALGFAAEIAENAPLAVEATRATLREGLLDAVAAQTVREGREQMALFATQDFKEGVRAVAERRPGQWVAA